MLSTQAVVGRDACEPGRAGPRRRQTGTSRAAPPELRSDPDWTRLAASTAPARHGGRLGVGLRVLQGAFDERQDEGGTAVVTFWLCSACRRRDRPCNQDEAIPGRVQKEHGSGA